MDYEPLNCFRNEIRLLTILPEPSELAAFTKLGVPTPVYCQFATFSLDDVLLRYRIWWWCQDRIKKVTPSRMFSLVLPVFHDGLEFYSHHFAVVWILSKITRYLSDQFLSHNFAALDTLVSLAMLLRFAYTSHPDFFLLFDNAREVWYSVRMGILNIVIFLGVHIPLVLGFIATIHVANFTSACLATFLVAVVRKTVWVSEMNRPNFCADTVLRYKWGDYAALSYTWGDPKLETPIFVNGKAVLVRENLAAALRMYRSSTMAEHGVKLWVDALSINQADVDERSLQVKRMLAIYRKAWTVVAWLGEEGENSAQAIRWINTFALFQKSIYGAAGRIKIARKIFETIDAESIEALGCFLARPYWSRMWITQELSVSRMDSPLFCGLQGTTWRAVIGMIDFMAQDWNRTLSKLRATGNPKLLDVTVTGISFSRLQNMIALFRGLESSTMALGRVSALCHSAQATDDRDKVYGCLGILNPAITASITPNYNHSVQHVYVNFTKAFIEFSGDLSIIHNGSRKELRKSKPTWTVDYRETYDRFRPGTDDPSNACLNRPAEFHISECTSGISCDSLLTCKGFLIDYVDGVSGNQMDWFGEHPDPSGIEQPTTAFHAYLDDTGLAAALSRTLIGWRLPDKLVLPVSVLKIPWFGGSRPNLQVPELLKGMHLGHILASEWYDDFESFRHVNASFNLFGRNLKEFFPQTIDLSEDFETLAWQMMFAAQGFFRRRLVTTKNGYLGLGVEAVRPGDKIFVLFGSKSPVALRPNPEGYKVVGEIYVHGVMNGEAMQWLEKGRCVLEDVVIC